MPTTPALSSPAALERQLLALRDELAELAYSLDVRGKLEAAEVALTIRARLDEVLHSSDGDAAEFAPLAELDS